MIKSRSLPKVSKPLSVDLPSYGVAFLQSIHDIDFQMRWRKDPFHKLIYVLNGSVTYFESGRKLQLPAGSFVGITADTTHYFEDKESSTLLLLCLSKDLVKENTELNQVWKAIVDHSKGTLQVYRSLNRDVENLWRRSMVEQFSLHIGRSLVITSNALHILVTLSRLYASPAPLAANERVRAFIGKLEETFYEDWNIDRACAEVKLSRRHFCLLFRKTTGASFLEKVLAVRLSHAATLLAEGNSSIVGVAFSCGYNDLSHFYRLFRKRYGLPPKQWAEKHRKNFSR